MLEELIEDYIKAKDKYDKFNQNFANMIPLMAAQSDYGEAADRLLEFIYKHGDTLIAWERQNALRLTPFEE